VGDSTRLESLMDGVQVDAVVTEPILLPKIDATPTLDKARKIVDFVVLRLGEKYWLGATLYVPDSQQFQVRSNERPVVSSQISISSRLARLLLNLGGVRKGGVVLDPFCGSGTILAEAITAGLSCIGVDRDRNRIENSRQNLEWLSKTLKTSTKPYTRRRLHKARVADGRGPGGRGRHGTNPTSQDRRDPDT
ncbi:MAG: DNA methyltransferase, partial [Nitrososphaerales archaeon]